MRRWLLCRGRRRLWLRSLRLLRRRILLCRLLRSPLSLRFLSFLRCRLLCALFCGLTMFVRRRSSWLLHRCLLCRCLLSRCLLRGCRLRRLLGPLLLLWLLLRGLLNLLWRPLCLRLLLAWLCLALLGLSLFALLVAAGCNRGGGLLGSSHS